MVNEQTSIVTLLLTFAKTSITSIKLAGPSDDATQTSAQSLPQGVRAKREYKNDRIVTTVYFSFHLLVYVMLSIQLNPKP